MKTQTDSLESRGRIHAIVDESSKIRAAFSSPEMRTVLPILNKIKAELSLSEFPMTIGDLDKHLAGGGLKTSERIALKAAMSRAGLLKGER